MHVAFFHERKQDITRAVLFTSTGATTSTSEIYHLSLHSAAAMLQRCSVIYKSITLKRREISETAAKKGAAVPGAGFK